MNKNPHISDIRNILKRMQDDLNAYEQGTQPRTALQRMATDAVAIGGKIALLSYAEGFNKASLNEDELTPLERYIRQSFDTPTRKYMLVHALTLNVNEAIITECDDIQGILPFIPKPPEGYILAAFDLQKPFEEQWPHAPGTVVHEIQLIENPVLNGFEDALASRKCDTKAIASIKRGLGIPHLRLA